MIAPKLCQPLICSLPHPMPLCWDIFVERRLTGIPAKSKNTIAMRTNMLMPSSRSIPSRNPLQLLHSSAGDSSPESSSSTILLITHLSNRSMMKRRTGKRKLCFSKMSMTFRNSATDVNFSGDLVLMLNKSPAALFVSTVLPRSLVSLSMRA